MENRKTGRDAVFIIFPTSILPIFQSSNSSVDQKHKSNIETCLKCWLHRKKGAEFENVTAKYSTFFCDVCQWKM